MNVGGWFSDVVWCCEIGLWVLHYWLSAVVVIILYCGDNIVGGWYCVCEWIGFV